MKIPNDAWKSVLARSALLMLIGGYGACSCAHAYGAASLCTSDEAVLFSCDVKDGKKVSLCASQPISASQGYLQYRFGKGGAVELQYPADLHESQKKFAYSHYSRYQVSRTVVSFENGGYKYSITNDYEGDMPGEKSTKIQGVEVSKGEKATMLACKRDAINKMSALESVIPCDRDDPVSGADCPAQ